MTATQITAAAFIAILWLAAVGMLIASIHSYFRNEDQD